MRVTLMICEDGQHYPAFYEGVERSAEVSSFIEARRWVHNLGCRWDEDESTWSYSRIDGTVGLVCWPPYDGVWQRLSLYMYAIVTR